MGVFITSKSAIGHVIDQGVHKVYSINNLNFCTAVSHMNEVKKGDGSFFHLPAVITPLGAKDCEVNRR